LEIDYRLTPNTMQKLAGDRPLYMNDLTRGNINPNEPVVRDAILMIRSPLITFDQIVLDDIKKHEINKVIYQAEKVSNLFSKWGFDQTIKYGKGMTMLFSGAPGTGKTATCDAIAHRLGKKLGVANYARIIDMWFGNSEKHLIKVFDEAKNKDCVLVFDEADSLFSQRENGRQQFDRTYNYMTNILMQELERFEGICILTTNREMVMDTAFKRRILLKLKFDVPASKERIKIWQALMPPAAPIDGDVDFVEMGSRFVLTGGEIKNVIMNVLRECSYKDEQKITMAVLTEYAEREIATSVKQDTKKYGFLSQ
jgi:SpoVK/Ycf46/Vps4 family AAA+-type ATPase